MDFNDCKCTEKGCIEYRLIQQGNIEFKFLEFVWIIKVVAAAYIDEVVVATDTGSIATGVNDATFANTGLNATVPDAKGINIAAVIKIAVASVVAVHLKQEP